MKNKVKQKVKRAGFKTQTELAEYLGVSKNTICKWVQSPSKLFKEWLDVKHIERLLREQIVYLYECIDSRDKEIQDLKGKLDTLEMLYKASKNNINEKGNYGKMEISK